MATVTEEKVDSDPVSSPSDSRSRPAVRRQGGSRWFFVLLLLGAVGSGAGYAVPRFSTGQNEELGALTHTVSRGQLLITVTEDGNVESASNDDVKCQVAGGATILWIVEDGKEVEKGDEVVRLDDSLLKEQLDTQRIALAKAEATMITTKENFAAAKIAVTEYVEGLYVSELQTLEANIKIAEQNLRNAENMLKFSEKMFRKGFVTQLQLGADRFAVDRSKLELGSAKTAIETLVKLTKEKMVRQLEAVRDAGEASMKSEKSAYDLEKVRLEKLEKQLTNCIVTAPSRGMVVWANSSSRRRSSQGPQIEEGALVKEQQTLIRLPDLSKMQVKGTVHETKVDQIKLGMDAQIVILDRKLDGEVVAVANQPEPGSWFSSDVKEYATTVKINGESSGLKPGMTAEVEIEIVDLQDVLSVPVAAVVEQRGNFYAWVQTPTGPEKRLLLLGQTNDKVLEVKDGLKERDEVFLNPRAHFAEARQDDSSGDKDRGRP